MVLPPENLAAPLVTEEQLVYLADKLVIDDRVAGLAARAARARDRHGRIQPLYRERRRVSGRLRSSAKSRVRSSIVDWKRCYHERNIRLSSQACRTRLADSRKRTSALRPPAQCSRRRAARRMADRLQQIRFSAAYSSDLQRSLRTAQIIVADAGLPVRPEIHLRR